MFETTIILVENMDQFTILYFKIGHTYMGINHIYGIREGTS